MTDVETSDIEEVTADWEKTELTSPKEDTRSKVGASYTELEEAYELNNKITTVRDLRLLADFLQDNPDLPFPSISSNVWLYSDEKFSSAVSKLGSFDKDYKDEYFKAHKPLSNTLKYSLSTYRETVCVKKVVGTETVEVPDYSNVPTKTEEKEIVEWECRPILERN